MCVTSRMGVFAEGSLPHVRSSSSFKLDLNAFFKPSAPPRFYQQESTRRFVVLSLTVCAGALFMASGRIAFQGRSSPQAVWHIFLTVFGLGSVLAGAALALRALPPHLNNVAYRNSLIDQFQRQWPYLCADQMNGLYAPLLDPAKRNQLLNAQLTEIRKLTDQDDHEFQVLNEIRQLEHQEGYNKRGFSTFFRLHPFKTLDHFFIEDPMQRKAFMTYLWWPRTDTSFAHRCQQASAVLVANAASADAIFTQHHSVFRHLLDFVLDPTGTFIQGRCTWLLANYGEQVFHHLTNEQKTTLKSLIRAWVQPDWKQHRDPVLQRSGGLLYRTVSSLPRSVHFDWMVDVQVPFLAQEALEELRFSHAVLEERVLERVVLEKTCFASIAEEELRLAQAALAQVAAEEKRVAQATVVELALTELALDGLFFPLTLLQGQHIVQITLEELLHLRSFVDQKRLQLVAVDKQLRSQADVEHLALDMLLFPQAVLEQQRLKLVALEQQLFALKAVDKQLLELAFKTRSAVSRLALAKRSLAQWAALEWEGVEPQRGWDAILSEVKEENRELFWKQFCQFYIHCSKREELAPQIRDRIKTLKSRDRTLLENELLSLKWPRKRGQWGIPAEEPRSAPHNLNSEESPEEFADVFQQT